MRVIRRRRFTEDSVRAYGWIAPDSPRAAARLLDEIEALVELLQEQPFLGHAREELPEGVRVFPLRRFRYLVLYRVEGDDLTLLRLIHGARRVGADDAR